MERGVKQSSEKKVGENHPIIKRKIDESLKLSIKEGTYASASAGFGTSYFTPYALALNATSSEIGILNALINLLPSIVQLKSSRLIETSSRKRLTIKFVKLQNLIYIPIILLSLFLLLKFPYSSFLKYLPWIFILLAGIFFAIGAVAYPPWFSWMGSLVPKKLRGKYFGKRNRIAGFFGLFSMLVGAIILDQFEKLGIVLIGFGVIFIIAFLLRVFTLHLLHNQYEPKLKIKKKDYFSLKDFIQKGRNTPFGRFTFFATMINLTRNIAIPFFAVYLLRDLGFSYFWFMAITVSGTLFLLFFYPIVGKFSDRYGNIKLLRISCLIWPLTPLLWVLSAYLPLTDLSLKFYLLIVPQIFSGFGFAGFMIASTNYIYDSVNSQKRSYGLTYFNFFTGMGLFLGALIGSGLALLNIGFMNTLLFIILVSGILRFVVYFIFSKSLKEVRYVRKATLPLVIRELNPASGIRRELHAVEHAFEKIEHHI